MVRRNPSLGCDVGKQPTLIHKCAPHACLRRFVTKKLNHDAIAMASFFQRTASKLCPTLSPCEWGHAALRCDLLSSTDAAEPGGRDQPCPGWGRGSNPFARSNKINFTKTGSSFLGNTGVTPSRFALCCGGVMLARLLLLEGRYALARGPI